MFSKDIGEAKSLLAGHTVTHPWAHVKTKAVVVHYGKPPGAGKGREQTQGLQEALQVFATGMI